MNNNGYQATVFATGLDHPEGLAAAPDGTIWAGGEAGQIYHVSETGQVRELVNVGGFNAGIALDAAGAIVVCNVPGRLLRVSAAGWSTIASAAWGQPLRVPNSAAFGLDGSLYMSDSGTWGVPDGQILRVHAGGAVSVFHPGPFHYPNGVATSVDGAYLYVVQSALHDIVRIRLSHASEARLEPVCRPGSLRWVPDGLAFDLEGNLYVTTYGSSRIYRIAPGRGPEIIAGDRLGFALNRPTNCAFGGPGRDKLFVANFGGHEIAVIDIGIPGQPLFSGLV